MVENKTCERCGQVIDENAKLYSEFLKSDKGRQHLRNADWIMFLIIFWIAFMMSASISGILFVSDGATMHYLNTRLLYICFAGALSFLVLILVHLRKRDRLFNEFKATRQP